MAVVAPMPSARVRMAVTAKPGDRRSCRSACFTSANTDVCPPWRELSPANVPLFSECTLRATVDQDYLFENEPCGCRGITDGRPLGDDPVRIWTAGWAFLQIFPGARKEREG